MKPQDTPGFGPGFYGKMPSRGDYLGRGLPPSFLLPWQDWLHGVWSAATERFGELWPPLTAKGPVWRFVLDGEVCGEHAVAGLLAPSCDRLGRVFPWSLVASLPRDSDPAALPVTASRWFGQAEQLIRRAHDPNLDLDGFEQTVRQLGPPGRSPLLASLPPASPGWRLRLDPQEAPALAYPALIRELADRLPTRFSLWWTLGTRLVAPSLVVGSGLPDADAFTALYDGGWDYWGWQDADEVGATPEA